MSDSAFFTKVSDLMREWIKNDNEEEDDGFDLRDTLPIPITAADRTEAGNAVVPPSTAKKEDDWLETQALAAWQRVGTGEDIEFEMISAEELQVRVANSLEAMPGTPLASNS